MAWVPFSKNKFKDKGLSQKQDLSPYKTTIAVPIYKFEFASLVSQIPLLFVKGEPGFISCGLMGIERNKNLFIDELGVWTGDFCPSFLSSYPLAAVHSAEEMATLIIDDSSDAIVDNHQGEAFFDITGNPTEMLNRRILSITKAHNEQKKEKRVLSLLTDFDLFEVMEFKLSNLEGSIDLKGFYKINKTKLDSMTSVEIEKLYQEGAFDYIYANLFSIPSIRNLWNLHCFKNQKRMNKKIFSEGNLLSGEEASGAVETYFSENMLNFD